MTIDVKGLKEELKAYNDLLEEYEGNYLNYYNVLSSFSFFWNDAHARKFYNSIPKEKLYYKNLLLELQSIRDVYKYMIMKYSDIGNHIHADLKDKDYILNKFDSYIDKCDDIINEFYNLNLSFCPVEARIIRKKRDSIIDCRDRMIEKRKSVKESLEKIENIENEVRYRINRIDVSIMKETDIRGMV